MGAKACKYCPCRTEIQGAGSVLDRVISQSSNEDQCILYKLANYKKGGELIDTYTLAGQIAVEKLIRERFGAYMYAEGRGQMINRAEYLRWKFRDQEHVVLPIEASLSRHDPLAKWYDHEACWQMRYRGALGESLLHVLIICDTKIHTRLARTLLKCFPRLALDVVEGEEYLGASSLHLAIAYSNNELVQDLVEAGSDVCQRAIGSFFLPRDQQRSPPTRHTDYEGLAYLGEYPLSWAACCANESVYNLLLDSGADPDLPDTFGNMILHMVVVCDKLDMFGYALRHPKLPASNGKINQEGLTPLTLACKLGRAEVFREMLELSAREFWRYSNITCSAYPLNALDTLLPDGRTNWNSALFIILNGTKEAHLDMLDGGIIQRLLEEKWKTFARNQFLKRLLILFTHLLLLSIAVYLRPQDATDSLLAAPDNAQDIMRYVCEIGTLIGVLSYLILQQGDEVKNQGLGAFLKQLSHAPDKAIFLVSNLLILACIPCRFTGDKSTEEAILVVAVPGSWFLLMFFAGAVRLTGPFVTMIYSMITGDMLTFGIIYTVVLFGFSQSFFFLYKGFPNVKGSLYSSYPSTWMALFQITLGDYSYSDLGYTTYPNLAKTVFALFMVFVPILLLNMLIAMMGNTYAHVIEQSEKEWMKQWAKIVVALERAVAQADAHHYLQEYSIALGPSDDPRYEQRGVMVIKSKAKTRAKQRKGAVSNWKRVGKVTITELRKRGMTGEDLRRIMWGRASISTPTKVPIKPKTDGILGTDGQNIAGAFGDAISSALDVMAFTHDFDLSGAAKGLNLHSGPPATAASGIAVQPGHIPATVSANITATLTDSTAKSTGVFNQTKLPYDTGGSVVGMLNQLSESQVPQDFTKKPALQTTSAKPTTVPPYQAVALPQPVSAIATANQQALSSTIIYGDPLRDLIILTEKSAYDSEDKIKALAIEAANCQHVEEVKIIPKPKRATMSTRVNAANAVSNIFGVVTVPADSSTAPSSWKSDKKKITILEPSDSEGFGDAPLLGRVSRTRRARSATQRSALEEENQADHWRSSRKRGHKFLTGHKNNNRKTLLLDLCGDTSSSEQTAGADNPGFEADTSNLGDLEYAASRIEQLRKSSLNIYRNPGTEPQSPVQQEFKDTMKEKRPLIIEQAAASIGPPAVMEVITEKAVIFQGEGSGAEVESGNSRREYERDRRKHDRKRQKQRPKTAKANRIAPMPRDHRHKSARHRGQSPDEERRSPPHPLNNWSTASLTNMNDLLAETDGEQDV